MDAPNLEPILSPGALCKSTGDGLHRPFAARALCLGSHAVGYHSQAANHQFSTCLAARIQAKALHIQTGGGHSPLSGVAVPLELLQHAWKVAYQCRVIRREGFGAGLLGARTLVLPSARITMSHEHTVHGQVLSDCLQKWTLISTDTLQMLTE